MIEGILIGLTTALTFQNILMVMVGCFFGTIIGMLPGLGPMTAIALMIPITYGFDPATGINFDGWCLLWRSIWWIYFSILIKCTWCSRNCCNFI
jgi:hypothetical protein